MSSRVFRAFSATDLPFSVKSVKIWMNADELKWLLTEVTWFGIQQSVNDQQIRQLTIWRVCLDACVKAKGKHFEHVLWYAVPQQTVNNLLWNLYSVFCFTTFSQPWLFKVLVLVVEQFLDTFIEFPTVKNTWSAKVTFCYKFIQVTACKKLTY